MDVGEEGEGAEEVPVLDESFLNAPAPHELSHAERQLLAEKRVAARRSSRLRDEHHAGHEESGRYRAKSITRRRRTTALVTGLIVGVFALAYFVNRSRDQRPTVIAPLTLPSSAFVPGTTAPAGATGPSGSTTATTLTLAAPGFSPGECVKWLQTGDSSPFDRPTYVIPCDQPHLVEVVAVGTAVAGLGAAWPGSRTLDAAAHRQCTPIAEKFLGQPVDPYGRFYVSAIAPSEQAWGVGHRTMWCDVQLNDVSRKVSTGPLRPYVGEARGASQTYLQPVGTCEPPGFDGPVPCNTPHVVEISGNVDLTAKTSSLPASESAWQNLVGSACNRLGVEYLGRAYPAGVESGWQDIAASSWDAGRRVVQCVVGKVAPNGGWVTLDVPLGRVPAA
jgi:hypothetical protein